jgi:large subunit ribosomal protein L3
MAKSRKPRKGSMQYWHRRQTRNVTARVRFWADSKEAKLLGFAGYKVGMTHALITDNRKTSLTKGEGIFCPVTIIECPPIKTASIRFYKKTTKGLTLISEIFAENPDKELERKITLPKKVKKKVEDIKDYDDVRLLVYTQPKLTGIGKKKPELFEIGIGGKKEDKLNYAKSVLGKEVGVKDIFKEGQQLDFHTITKGKGFQGPVKRFGIGLRAHKSEKVIRGPGSLGGWKGQGHFMYRIAHAGRMGYHQRTEYNKWLLKIGEKAEEVNSKGGFTHFGVIKNPYLFVKGSIGGSVNRMVKITAPTRPNKLIPSEAPQIQYVSLT